VLQNFFKLALLWPLFVLPGTVSHADPAHAVAIHGAPALSESFESLPYADIHAPRGGRIVYGERGRFDSLNGFATKGRAPSVMRSHVFESLMARSWDEPFTLYGLLAETIDIAPDHRSVTFAIRPEARFSDGSPVTVQDIVFSMEILRDAGRPNFGTYYRRVSAVEQTGDRSVTFTFHEPERELPLLLGLMPIHSRADWEGRAFDETTLVPPVASGPYRIVSLEAGDRIVLERRADYWGRDLPINRGLHNFDTVTVLYFRNGNALWEAFTAGEVDLRQETDPARWLDGYDFPAAAEGRIERAELPHGRATGMKGLVFNTRNPLFADRRVREALLHAFDFEWINAALHRGAYARIPSYYANSRLAATGPATGRERALLVPFADALPPGAMEGNFALPVSTGDGRNRANLRTATRLLREAGWRIREGTLKDAAGDPFAFEILLQGSGDDEKVAASFARSLERLGIGVSLRLVDGAQYRARLETYDFDMIVRQWWLSLAPGGEQEFYFGSRGVTEPGTRNYMGAKNPAIDAMIEALLEAEDEDTWVAAIRALDRVLTSERYVIPLWYDPVERLAWRKPLNKPARTPLYGYRPEVWWYGAE